jgi:RNA polymerase sigma-70 factor (ECF subfamily)
MLLSLDGEQTEGRFGVEPADARTPEALFERRWALTVLERALDRVRIEWERAGKTGKSSRLQACLTGEPLAGGHARLARDLGISEGAVEVAVHRLRQEYGRALRAEVADTLDDPAAVDEEVRELTRILGNV